VAALAVVAGHAYILGGRVLPVKAQNWHDVPLITTATAVWLFFAISGYVISRPFVRALVTGAARPGWARYALRRALRIYPLYWVALTAVILISGRGGAQIWQLPFHYLLLHNLIPGQEGGALFSVSWTLTLEVLFYVSVPLIAAGLARRYGGRVSPERLALLVVLSWIASIGFNFAADFVHNFKYLLWLRVVFPAQWQMFCPGILLAIAPYLSSPKWRRWLVELPASRAGWGLMGATLIAGALLNAIAPLRFGLTVYVLLTDASRPLLAVGFGLVLAAALRARPVRSRAVLELGLASYGIYLLHPILDTYLLTHGGHSLVLLPHRGGWPYLVHVATLAAPTIPLAILSWHWLEKPALRLAGTLGEFVSGRQRRLGLSLAGFTASSDSLAEGSPPGGR
jgi:peptidoglycan/LPS O-acetylase OafA/YrhL